MNAGLPNVAYGPRSTAAATCRKAFTHPEVYVEVVEQFLERRGSQHPHSCSDLSRIAPLVFITACDLQHCRGIGEAFAGR